MIKEKVIIFMIGLPRCGKSTYIMNVMSDTQIVCKDDIRLALGTQFNTKLETIVILLLKL